MNNAITFTQRELKEIAHAIHYARNYAHGTVGHNMLLIIARFALNRGFKLGPDGDPNTLTYPEGTVIVEEEPRR